MSKVTFYCISAYQRTPLHIAAGRGHRDIVKYLAENRADTKSKDKFGVSI